MTYFVMDNEVYGMTMGQACPTSALDWAQGNLTPRGTGIRPCQPVGLALAAGASFIARGFAEETTHDPATAARRIQADDGLSLGILHRSGVPVFQPGGPVPEGIPAFEHGFRL